MKKHIIKLILIALLVLGIILCIYSGTSNISSQKPSNHKQFVIIKADDLRYNTTAVSPEWIKFFEYIEDKNLKASAGIIGIALETDLNNSKEEVNSFVDTYLKNASKRDTFEFWNHGYRHNVDLNDPSGENISEFWRTSYEYQKEHLLKTQDLAKEKLNITLHAFGAPCNKIDNNTAKIIENISDIKVWFYGNNYSDKLVAGERRCAILENNGSVNYKEFLDDYYSLNCDKEDILALQIHPDKWDDESFEQFKEAVDFLIKQNATFIKPYEYYELVQK